MSNLSPHPRLQRSFIPNAPTMTSREIAQLVGKRHDNVKRLIESLIEQRVIAHPQIEDVQETGGNNRIYTTSVYRFSGDQGKRDSIVIVSQLSPEFTARLVDRWMELEQRAALATFSIPDTLHGALQLAADLAKDKADAEQALLEAAPKAAFHDAVTEAVNCQTVQEVAKVLGTGPNRLFKFMRDESMLLDNNLPYQSHIDAGHFKVVERCRHDHRGEGHTYTRTLVTGKGLAYIQRKLQSPLPLLRAA